MKNNASALFNYQQQKICISYQILNKYLYLAALSFINLAK